MWAYQHNLPAGVVHAGVEKDGEKKTSRYWHPCVVKNGEYVPTTLEQYGPDMHSDFALDFIRRKKDQPFFLYYTMCLTHAPHVPTPDTWKEGMDKFAHSNKNYKGAVEYADKLVGKLMSELDKLGLRDNTVVFFTGDNGTGGEGKAQPTELGARVPMIINGGRIKTRGKTMELTDLSDVMPTMMEMAGAPLPGDRPIDGVSLAPFLLGKTDTTREWIHSFLGDARILRTKRWLLEDNTPNHYGHLYDCGESRNGVGYKEVTASEDPEVLAIKEKLKALIDKLPAPIIPEEGNPTDKKPERAERRKRRNGEGDQRKKRSTAEE
jgi:arylsulfatase A